MLQSVSPSLGPDIAPVSESPPCSGAGLHQEDRGLLQEARRQNGGTGTLRTNCTHLCTLCGRRRQHAICRVRSTSIVQRPTMIDSLHEMNSCSCLGAHVCTCAPWVACHTQSLCSCPLSIARRSLLWPEYLPSEAHSGCGCHRFGAYNVGGALLWTFMFVGAGFFLGNLPAVKHNFTLVVLGIVAVRPHPGPCSALPLHDSDRAW